MRNPLLYAVASSLLVIGCTASGTGQVHYSAQVSAPPMVYIDSDVRVISNHDEPIFYTDSFYWRQTGGVWYRSPRHNGGWVVYAAPQSIRRIQRPSTYVRYRARANVGHDRRPAARETRRENNRPDQQRAYDKNKNDKNDKKNDRRNYKD